MKIGKFILHPRVLKSRIYKLLSVFWPVPFKYFVRPVLNAGRTPHPFKPRALQDLIIRNMMIPDNIMRAVTADKIAARGWASEKIGQQYLIPLYGIFDDLDTLGAQEFPYPYVVKTNHASGQYCFVHDSQSKQAMLEKAKTWNMGPHNPTVEWTYLGIKPKFMVEKALIAEDQPEVLDVKLYCLHGEPVLIHRISGREKKAAKTFFTADWQMTNYNLVAPSACESVPRPDYLDELLNLGRVLSDGFDFCRVDFLVLSEKLYFGELTSSPTAGEFHLNPLSFDEFLYQEYERLGREKIAAKRLAYANMVVTEFGSDTSQS